MEPRPGKQLHIEVASYHEAGHALTALHERRKVLGLSVSLGAPGDGLCVFARGPSNPFDIGNGSSSAQGAWEHTLAKACGDIRIALAGPLAEAIALGKPLRSLGARSDLEDCMRTAIRLVCLGTFASQFTTIGPVDANKIMAVQMRGTRRWLSRPKIWRAIKLIAATLQTNGKLDSKELDQLVGAAGMPDEQYPLDFIQNRLVT